MFFNLLYIYSFLFFKFHRCTLHLSGCKVRKKNRDRQDFQAVILQTMYVIYTSKIRTYAPLSPSPFRFSSSRFSPDSRQPSGQRSKEKRKRETVFLYIIWYSFIVICVCASYRHKPPTGRKHKRKASAQRGKPSRRCVSLRLAWNALFHKNLFPGFRHVNTRNGTDYGATGKVIPLFPG